MCGKPNICRPPAYVLNLRTCSHCLFTLFLLLFYVLEYFKINTSEKKNVYVLAGVPFTPTQTHSNIRASDLMPKALRIFIHYLDDSIRKTEDKLTLLNALSDPH